MRCQRCGQKTIELCTNCESYLFDNHIGLTISGSGITRLLEEKQKLGEKCKELKVNIINLKIGITISVSVGLALGGYVYQLKSLIETLRPHGKVEIAKPDPTDHQGQIGPNQYIEVRCFSIQEPQREVAIPVSAECSNCIDKSLTMLILNEYNFRRFERQLDYTPRYQEFEIEKFGFDDKLERGRYYIVFHNSSMSSSILVKIGVDVNYK